MAKRFQRRIESFRCENCSKLVEGDGYTNHCPHCLWSKHVDVNPGDRAATCKGMMEPLTLEHRGGEIRIVHRCTRCSLTRPNRLAKDDNYETLLSCRST